MLYSCVASMQYLKCDKHGNEGLKLFSVNNGVHSTSIIFLVCLAMLLGFANHLHTIIFMNDLTLIFL